MTNATRTLDLDQLATVSGGTAAETAELKQAILSNPSMAKIWERKYGRYGFSDAQTCHLVLLEAFDVLYADCSEEDPNVYTVKVGGEEKYRLSHEALLKFINCYGEF